MKKLITSESVSFGHPDKIADQISDAILDEFLKSDPDVQAGIETMVKDNIVVLGGEITSTATIDYGKVIREVYKTFNFSKEHNLSPENIKIINLIGKQSPQINKAVVKENGEIGAGDQGFMVGYAIADTPDYMPLGLYIAKRLLIRLLSDFNEVIGPDAKSQVTIEEDTETGTKRIHTILISTMHLKNIGIDTIRTSITQMIKDNETDEMGMLPEDIHALIDENTKIVVNPAGEWTIGGPVADCGLTGRKIVVDHYGAYCSVGGGSLSSKSPSKVDRSASYLARYIAKNIVASGLAHSCKVEIAYMIGIPEPVSINIRLFSKEGRRLETPDNLVEKVKNLFPMTPKQIIEHFDLKRPIYYNLARNGHFGFEGDENRPWEKTDVKL